MTVRDEWRWTDEQGVQRLVRTEELRAALASSVLPPSTLVWREGMKEWAPAFTMPEFASAAAAAAAAKPERDDGAGAAATTDRSTPTDVMKEPLPATAVAAAGSGGEPSKPPLPVGAARARMQTLVGINSSEDERPSVPAAPPINVPAAGAGESRTAVITQLPRFGSETIERPASTTIPRAPRLPSAAPEPLKPFPDLRRTQIGHGSPKPPQERKARTSEIDALWGGPARPPEDSITDTLVNEKISAPPPAEPAAPVAPAEPPRAGASERPAAEPPARTGASEPPAAARPLSRPPPRPPPVPIRKPTSTVGSSEAPKPLSAAPPKRTPSQRPPPPPVPVRRPTGSHTAATPAPPTTQAPSTMLGGFTAGAGGAAGARTSERPPAAEPAPARTTTSERPSAKRPPPIPPPRTATPPPGTAAIVGGTAKLGTLSSKPPAVSSAKPEASASAAIRPIVDIGPPPMSAPPPLVGRLQVPSSSLPSTGPPADAQSSTSDADAGVPTANMPAVVDPAAAQWLVQTTTSQPPAALAKAAASAAASAPPSSAAQPAASAAEPAASAPSKAKPILPPPGGPMGPLPPPEPLDSGVPALSGTPRSRASDRPPLRGLRSIPPLRSLPPLNEPVEMPFGSLLAIAGTLIVMVVSAFLIGRCSNDGDPRSPGLRKASARMSIVPVLARAALPPAPKPCWVARQPVMWAPSASKSIPFELVPTDKGSIAMGYARAAREAVGIEVNPASGEVAERFLNDRVEAEIERVSPAQTGQTFLVSSAARGGPLRSMINIPAASPFVLGVREGSLVAADTADATATALWPLAGEEDLKTLHVQLAEDKGFAVTLRRQGAVHGGWVGPDRKAATKLTKVQGSGGAVGKPMSGWNEHELAVVFADRPADATHWQIRVGRAPTGSVPDSTVVVPLPKGGPGGDAFAPDIAALPDGRWLLIWTEGPAGSRAIRAQTLAPDLSPLGDPIALSPPAGNFGQGVLGVVNDYAAAVFLQKGRMSYELWGAILQCG